jgi:methionine synthase II (cobalamin-independent)
MKFKNITPEEIREEIRNNVSTFYAAGVKCIELDTPTWLHVDCRSTVNNAILWVPYK